MANEVNNETEANSSPQTNQNESAAETANTAATETPANDAPQNAAAPEVEPPVIDDNQKSNNAKTKSPEEDFGAILEKFEGEQTDLQAGDLIEGTVISVSERGVTIDFGYKSEGIVPVEEFTALDGTITVAEGDKVEVILKTMHSGDSPPTLSKSDADNRRTWDELDAAFENETPIKARVFGTMKGGLRVDINGLEAFMPGSLADSRPGFNINSLMNKEIEARIVKFSRRRNNIIVSRKALTDEVINKQKAETFANIGKGYVVEGKIRNLTEYGAFIDIGGIDGLLHVTDMSWNRQQNTRDLFKPNETVQVKILSIDRDKEKISLGYKQLIPDPWSSVVEIYPVNARVKGKVSSVTEYGLFVELEPGVEGLVHISEISWSKRTKPLRADYRSGDEIEVQILGVDTVDRRISLGVKQLQPNPWQTVDENFHVGDVVKGIVRSIADFGAFVEVADGIEGLVHVSDIVWNRKLKTPKEVLKRDQEVEAIIKSVDKRNRRMSLSIKELEPSAWDKFAQNHKPGDVVRGKVTRFAGFGVFVALGDDIEGLCHISELADERIERAEDVVKIDQELDFKILRIESGEQKIALSARAVGKENEPVVDHKNYSTEAKGGMASLGELMNLKRGGAAEEPAKEQPKMSKKDRKALKALKRAEEDAEAEDLAATIGDDTEPAADDAPPTTDEDSAANTEESAETDASTELLDNATDSNDSNDAAVSEDAETAPTAEADVPAETETNDSAETTTATENDNAAENNNETAADSNETPETSAVENVAETDTQAAKMTDTDGEAASGENTETPEIAPVSEADDEAASGGEPTNAEEKSA